MTHEEQQITNERDQWMDQALRLKEEKEELTRENIARAKEYAKLLHENEVLKQWLASATRFTRRSFTLRADPGGFRWEVLGIGGDCLFCSLPPEARPASCYFDTYKEAEAAATKALEVAG